MDGRKPAVCRRGALCGWSGVTLQASRPGPSVSPERSDAFSRPRISPPAPHLSRNGIGPRGVGLDHRGVTRAVTISSGLALYLGCPMAQLWPRVFHSSASFFEYAKSHPEATAGSSPGPVGARLGLSRSRISQLIHEGELHAYVVYDGRFDSIRARPQIILITADSVDAYASKPKNKGGRPRTRLVA